MEVAAEHNALSRLPTGIAGLDTITNGGLIKGGIYLVMGPPGTGKTIMGNQICFNRVAAGGKAVYVTILAESHARMLAHIAPLSFYDPSAVGENLYFISGHLSDEKDGLADLLTLLQHTLRGRRPDLLVIDGMSTAEQAADSSIALKEFVHKLHVYAEAVGCTTILLTHVGSPDLSNPEHTMVDGVIEFRDHYVGMRTLRELEVRKLRGTWYLRGKHSYEITDDGIVIHPRTEALLSLSPRTQQVHSDRLGFGIEELDKMLNGGVIAATKTLLFGASGSGKTLLGMHFLAEGARIGQTGLYLGFNEMPGEIVGKTDQAGLHIGQYVENGLLEIAWQYPPESSLDILAERLLAMVRTGGVQRLFLDGVNALRLSDHPERISGFIIALTNELSNLGVSTIFSVEMHNMIGPTVDLPSGDFSIVADNVILMRYVELRSQLYRLLSILKIRAGEYDTHIREFRISNNGIAVASTFASAEAVLTGIARLIRPEDAPHAALKDAGE